MLDLSSAGKKSHSSQKCSSRSSVAEDRNPVVESWLSLEFQHDGELQSAFHQTMLSHVAECCFRSPRKRREPETTAPQWHAEQSPIHKWQQFTKSLSVAGVWRCMKMDTSLEATEVGVKSSSTSSGQRSSSHVHVKLASYASSARMPRLPVGRLAGQMTELYHILLFRTSALSSVGREHIGCSRVGDGRVAANRVRA